MFDKENGIYPSGQYLVGRDIPLGGYVLSTIEENTNSSYAVYKSYKDFKNGENEISYILFKGDFHISLMEENMFIEIENATMQRV